ncbi:transglutaminase family protein [Paraconexibacter algicola]|uniref:Transglutaminase family protein n=1 Tax=Paraconexibacter algicola TaxID=2133960 RepID=A0A2T4UBL4_9ACTN|nr:transglutaminase family protein [Paraconexibacter algicola]PTL54284.1 transglutaminase family protein [Paraconexibacter algicola]
MNFQIRYLTEYRYDGPVSDNLNALRVRPATTSTQRCDDFQFRTDPETRVQSHRDYFGTEVIEFGIPKIHDHLTIDVRARVVTSEPAEPPESSWEALGTPAYEEAAGEFLLPGPAEPPEGLLDGLVETTRATTPLATLKLLCELIPDRFRYDQTATYVGSTVEDLLRVGGGVCQDFVHLGLLLLRRHGIAARYVSGYLWAAPADGSLDSMEVHTHAWLEALLPTEERGEPVWVGADPTNRRLAGETHVKIGHGRHYVDVPPIKGVYRGVAQATYEASVKLTRLDPATSARA